MAALVFQTCATLSLPPHVSDSASLLALFHERLLEDFLQQIQVDNNLRRNHCVSSPAVTMWLLLSQRLHEGASLESAVLLLRSLPGSFSKVRHIVDGFAAELARATDPEATQRIFDQMMIYI